MRSLCKQCEAVFISHNLYYDLRCCSLPCKFLPRRHPEIDSSPHIGFSLRAAVSLSHCEVQMVSFIDALILLQSAFSDCILSQYRLTRPCPFACSSTALPHSPTRFCGHAIASKPCITAFFNCYEWGIQLRFGNRLLACSLSLSLNFSLRRVLFHTRIAKPGSSVCGFPFFSAHSTLGPGLINCNRFKLSI